LLESGFHHQNPPPDGEVTETPEIDLTNSQIGAKSFRRLIENSRLDGKVDHRSRSERTSANFRFEILHH